MSITENQNVCPDCVLIMATAAPDKKRLGKVVTELRTLQVLIVVCYVLYVVCCVFDVDVSENECDFESPLCNLMLCCR